MTEGENGCMSGKPGILKTKLFLCNTHLESKDFYTAEWCAKCFNPADCIIIVDCTYKQIWLKTTLRDRTFGEKV